MRENGVASDKPLDNLIVTRMRKFGGLNALKRQAMQFIVQTLSPEELAGLRNQFMVRLLVVSDGDTSPSSRWTRTATAASPWKSSRRAFARWARCWRTARSVWLC